MHYHLDNCFYFWHCCANFILSNLTPSSHSCTRTTCPRIGLHSSCQDLNVLFWNLVLVAKSDAARDAKEDGQTLPLRRPCSTRRCYRGRIGFANSDVCRCWRDVVKSHQCSHSSKTYYAFKYFMRYMHHILLRHTLGCFYIVSYTTWRSGTLNQRRLPLCDILYKIKNKSL